MVRRWSRHLAALQAVRYGLFWLIVGHRLRLTVGHRLRLTVGHRFRLIVHQRLRFTLGHRFRLIVRRRLRLTLGHRFRLIVRQRLRLINGFVVVVGHGLGHWLGLGHRLGQRLWQGMPDRGAHARRRSRRLWTADKRHDDEEVALANVNQARDAPAVGE